MNWEPLRQIKPDLFLLDLPQHRTGFRKFISCWIIRHRHRALLIDPGPASTIPLLMSALEQLEITEIRCILLTHIHLDHAGGIGHFVRIHPDAKVLCHPGAHRHLTNPEKLWRGSLKVLGDLAGLYGQPLPVPETNLFYRDTHTFSGYEFTVLETPGHAPHHLSFLCGNTLFAGEACGIVLREDHHFYSRPATPPVFKYEVYRDSMRKLTELKFSELAFAHFGIERMDASFIKNASSQLDIWLEVTSQFLEREGSCAQEKVFNTLLREDPLLASFPRLSADLQQRERYFCLNSLRGIGEYLDAKNQ